MRDGGIVGRRGEQVVSVRLRVRFCGLGLVLPQPLHFARDDEVFVLAERDAVFSGELLGAFSDKVDVRAFAQDLARDADGIAEMFDASYTASAERGSVHDERIELY